MPHPKIKRALISVYDKTGIVEFAKALVEEFSIEIISTGGTAKLLKEAGLPVTLVEEVTGFPEMMDGRVKTLHPKIHAAILADRDNPEHMRQLEEQGIKPIDMVVVNLYPFEETVNKPDCTFEQAIEMIDIGGPCLLRAAAKNHKHVLVVCDRRYFSRALGLLRGDSDEDAEYFKGLAAYWVFGLTQDYDLWVRDYLMAEVSGDASGVESHPALARSIWLGLEKRSPSRYGENPHQKGAFYRLERGEAHLKPVGSRSKKLASFNNNVDADAAFELCSELTRELCKKCVGPASQPVSRRITAQRHTERHLPHIEDPGAHYFLTFRLRAGTLAPLERRIVLESCKYWHRKKMTLHACVVMPDHVHMVVTPHEVAPGEWVALGEILHSIKSYSAQEVNKRRRSHGALWLDETWDRIIRGEREYQERWEYIDNNPEKAGLSRDYEWLWLNDRAWEDLAECDRLGSRSHTDDRLEGRSHTDDRMESRSHTDDRMESRSHTDDRMGSRSHMPTGQGCTAVFVKHTNACGVGVAQEPIDAYRLAYRGDPNAAMGGVLVCNFTVTHDFASAVMGTYARWGKDAGVGGFFVEVWVAPSFDDQAIETIRAKKKWGERVRLLAVGNMTGPPGETELDYKKITGGMLVQTRDLVGLNEDQWKVVTERKPTDKEMADLRLAWLICKHTKSNAITICKENMLIGNGAGQMSRVMSCRIATWLAKENGHQEKLGGAVAASDAFFPFRDGPDLLMDAGVTAIIQPGGSKRDEDTIAACNERGAAMILTGTRHFKH